MEHRLLGRSGLKVPVLSFGTATFGGGGDFFKAWGSTDVAEAKRLIDVCLDHELNFFDTANVYSAGAAEEILGEAIAGKRDKLLISTKATFPMGSDPNDRGSSRQNIIKSCEKSLRRLKTDYIDLYHMHGQDIVTPVEETVRALDDLVTAGKVRYVAASNFSAWHLQKSLDKADQENRTRYVAHQIYYSLVGRDAEWELLPLGLDQNVSSMIWSPLAGGALTGKIRRDKAAPKDSRLGQISFVKYKDEILFDVIEVLEKIAKEREKTIPQVALNWLLRKKTVANIIVGARNETQLIQNFGALGWELTKTEVEKLDEVTQPRIPYPYWHQKGFEMCYKPLPTIAQ